MSAAPIIPTAPPARPIPPEWRADPLWENLVIHLQKSVNPQAHMRGACDHSHRVTRRVLFEHGASPEQVQASVEYYEAHGGRCDCEVIFNVVWPWIESLQEPGEST